jgi:hypothetical protein
MSNKQIVLEALRGLAELGAINDEISEAERVCDRAFEPGGILADMIVTIDRSADRETLSEVSVTADESVDASEIETFPVPCQEVTWASWAPAAE